MPTKLALASFYTLALLFGFLFAVLFAVMYFLEVINAAWLFGLTIGINVLIWLIGPHITDFIQKLFYKMKFLSREEFQKEYPALEAFIATVARDNKIRFPKMGIIDDQNPTAFTYGSGAFNARIILAKGLFTYLSQEELEAVTAHELGHIVHRDFIVMAIANTIIQLLYELSQVLFRQKGKKGKDKGGALAIIGAVSYIFYWIGYYIVLYLSRIRETFADEFSARATGNPHALSNALIKIAYGMIATGDTKRSDRLIKSTQTLGIMGIKASKGVGLAAMATNMDTQKIGRVLLYDFVSPWAKLAELGSTHPLTGKRLERLDRIAKKIGKQELFQIGHLLQDNIVDKKKLWNNFFSGIFMAYLPNSIAAAGVLALGVVYFNTETASAFSSIALLIVMLFFPLLGMSIIIKALYRYPSAVNAPDTNALALMSNLYATPVRGTPMAIRGSVIGRGVSGYVFSEDVMLQDETGLMYLDYQSGVPLIGNLLFAWKKVKQLIGEHVIARGWFFRSAVQSVTLQSIEHNGTFIKSYAKFWNIFFGALLIFIGIVLVTIFVS